MPLPLLAQIAIPVASSLAIGAGRKLLGLDRRPEAPKLKSSLPAVTALNAANKVSLEQDALSTLDRLRRSNATPGELQRVIEAMQRGRLRLDAEAANLIREAEGADNRTRFNLASDVYRYDIQNTREDQLNSRSGAVDLAALVSAYITDKNKNTGGS